MMVELHFPASNNQAEYEALLRGMEMARKMGITHLVAHSDSQLVVRQVLGEYGTIEPILMKYRDRAREEAKKLPRMDDQAGRQGR